LLSFRFFGSARRDGERVDRIVHQFAERPIHHAVARHRRLAGEARRDDGEAPVRAAAFAPAGMAGVLRALIDELQRDRLEGLQALPDGVGERQDFSST
jgi:hypothetical protein